MDAIVDGMRQPIQAAVRASCRACGRGRQCSAVQCSEMKQRETGASMHVAKLGACGREEVFRWCSVLVVHCGSGFPFNL
jgi:hypothetical protein